MIADVTRAERPATRSTSDGKRRSAIRGAPPAPIPVLATDIDPIAVRVAKENARRNGIVSGIEFRVALAFTRRRSANTVRSTDHCQHPRAT